MRCTADVTAPSAPGLPVVDLERSVDLGARRKRMLLTVNPHASTVSPRLQQLVRHALDSRFDVEAIETSGRGHATTLAAHAAAEGFDVVTVLAGDGTINEAANGLLGTDTALMCLPGGSGNVYNRVLGFPSDVIDATERLLGLADLWRPRHVRVGRVGERRFLFSAGVGLDAEITAYVDAHPRLKHRFRERYFAYAAFKVYGSHYVRRPPQLETTFPGCERPLRGVTTVVQKADPYTYFGELPLRASAGAAVGEPVLSGMTLRTARPTVVPGVVWRLFSREHDLTRHRQIDGFERVPEVTVCSRDGRPVPMHVDGDHIGDVTVARFELDPQPLLVLS